MEQFVSKTETQAPVGFGAYRVSVRSAEHYESLVMALKMGCQLIDTSSNYTDGESEELVGKVLKENPQFDPLVVTKSGYIQGNNKKLIEEEVAKGRCEQDLLQLSDSLWHSIHPEFLELMIKQSLERLQKQSLDVFLLHNPEYYFESEGATEEEYYNRIHKAFVFLEEQVEKGVIGAYGISSNTFIKNPTDKNCTNIEKVYEQALKIGAGHNFKYVQFPFNMIEIDALEKFYDGLSLIDKAKALGLKIMTNRPLNAFKGEDLVRLATYENSHPPIDDDKANEHFNYCFGLIEKKWKEQESNESLDDIVLVKQIKEMWNTIPTPDAVDQVFYGHFFPFIAGVWGGDGLSVEDSQPFYDLYEMSQNYSRQIMSKKAKQFESQAEEVGLIAKDDRPLSEKVIETYLNYGVDHVLVGMKNPFYVIQLKKLFK